MTHRANGPEGASAGGCGPARTRSLSRARARLGPYQLLGEENTLVDVGDGLSDEEDEDSRGLMEQDRKRRSMAHLQAKPYDDASDEDTEPAGVGAHGPGQGQGDPETYGNEDDDDGREHASEEDDRSRPRRHVGGEGHNREEEASSRIEKGTEDEDDSLVLRSFLRDMRTSLRGVSSKQDSQHSMIVDLGNQLREETAGRRRDVSAISKRFENLHICRCSEEEEAHRDENLKNCRFRTDCHISEGSTGSGTYTMGSISGGGSVCSSSPQAEAPGEVPDAGGGERKAPRLAEQGARPRDSTPSSAEGLLGVQTIPAQASGPVSQGCPIEHTGPRCRGCRSESSAAEQPRTPGVFLFCRSLDTS